MELSAEQRQAIEAQKQNCPFCMIVAGKIPAQRVYEDETLIGILDINPAAKGHVLLLPKEHYPILPLMPKEHASHLFRRLPELMRHLREARVAKHCTFFIASGQAAGQMSSHLTIHLIPSDSVPANFQLPARPLDGAKLQQVSASLRQGLPAMLGPRAERFPLEAEAAENPQSKEPSRLAEMIHENPEFKRMIIEKPDAVLAGLAENPGLQPLFEGVDLHELSRRLASLEEKAPAPAEPVGKSPESAPEDQDLGPTPAPQAEPIPMAVQFSDEQLAEYIDSKPKLQKLLLEDVETLEVAAQQQPRLARFFEDTSVGEVRARYLRGVDVTERGTRWGSGA